MNAVEEFPVLTRSRRVPPEVLQVLQNIDTWGARRPRATGRALSQLDAMTLLTLPEIVERAVGSDHPEFFKVLHRLAVLYHSRDDPQKAESLYRRALTIAERAFPEPNTETGLAMNNLGRLLYDRQKYAEGEEFCRRSIKILRALLGDEHPKLATPLNNLAVLCLSQNLPEQAEDYFEDSITILVKAHGPAHPKVTKARTKWAAAKAARQSPPV